MAHKVSRDAPVAVLQVDPRLHVLTAGPIGPVRAPAICRRPGIGLPCQVCVLRQQRVAGLWQSRGHQRATCCWSHGSHAEYPCESPQPGHRGCQCSSQALSPRQHVKGHREARGRLTVMAEDVEKARRVSPARAGTPSHGTQAPSLCQADLPRYQSLWGPPAPAPRPVIRSPRSIH